MGTEPRQNNCLTESVARFIDARRLIEPAGGVVVAVSGGCDSVALLAVLRELADRPGCKWQLTVAHLNHGLRKEADADAEFVAELADKWHMACVVERVDVAAEARRTGRGIEEAGRSLRYDFLSATAAKLAAACVAVGHHADDNVETVLSRILRGTHLRGLAGMPAIRKLQGCDIMLIRPLLQ